MKKIVLICVTLLCALTVSAQSADKLYRDGKALYDAKDYAAAVPLLKAAAEKGHRKAQYRLGRCYDKGRGVAEDERLAFQWYSKSAKQEYAKAQYQVGKFYKDGKGGVEKDRKTAVAYFAKAARQDNADGQYALGKAYMKGKGIAADQKKAKSWLKKAVDNEKGGDEILAKIKADAAAGDEDGKAILKLIGK